MTTLVGGRYRLDQRIATGGMGEVWRATDTVLARIVAIKLLKSEYADDATSRARFEAEAQHTAQLHHPGIAAIFDFGEHTLESGDTTAYLVMELVDGQPLSALLRPGQPLDFAVTARIIADAAEAVQVAHDAGIVHRDIKPANLLVTPAGSVKVTDFGISRAGDGVPLTQTGEVIGTPHYLAPEQAVGKAVTPATDIYSLGVVLYECLAGRRPFEASTPVAIALAHVREQPPPLPDQVPPGLAASCRQAMAKDPAQRPESATAFASAVRAAPTKGSGTRVLDAPVPAAAGPAAAPPPDATMTIQGPGSRRRRRRWLVPALAVAAVIVVIAATVALASTLGGGGSGVPPATPESATNEPATTPSDTSSPSETTPESPTPTPSETLSEEPAKTKDDNSPKDHRSEDDRPEDDESGDDESGDDGSGDDAGEDGKPGKGGGRDNGKGQD